MHNSSTVIQPSDQEKPKKKLEIHESIVSRITFASHQNDVAVIADLRVVNPLEISFEDLELKITCEPPLFDEKTWKIDRLSAGSEIQIQDRRVSLSAGILNQQTERVRATVTLKLMAGEDILVHKTRELVGLAKNEWGGSRYMPELLAAFVMPNDPAISTILKEAGEILRKSGKQPALDGYSSKSRRRVWEIASAIWSTISSRRLVYAVPPASFELEGQKVRTPTEVWGDGLTTCLDSTVLFAAALEQAGLNPLITLTKGHALCGVWLQPQQLMTLTTDDCSEVRKHISLKELALFETTLISNEPPVNFSKAIDAASRQLSEEVENDFVYALDIKRARGQQITPLAVTSPVAKRDDDDELSLCLALEAAPSLPAFDIDVNQGGAPDSPETRLDKWKRKLLDLTKRNRLLNLRDSKIAIRLHCSDPGVLEDKLADGKRIRVIPFEEMTGREGERDSTMFHLRTGDDYKRAFIEAALDRDEVVSDSKESDLRSGLTQLYRKAKSDLEEGGANTLFLAVGILKWKQSVDEQRYYRAPLILVPVKLERPSAASKVTIAHHDDEPVFNMTLLEMLRQDFDLRIPVLEGELPEDEHGIDVPLVLEAMKKAVRDMAGFEVVEEVVLSTFSFAKFLMWKDLSDRTDELKETMVVKHLIEHPRDPYDHSADFIVPHEIDEKIDPGELFMPLPADSSQIVAVHASSKGGDFVLEGPPGTGKSQTIANIIAHNLALGRKVLFVSEKMAALEVVYRRLRDRGLGDFCLELHSNKTNKRHVLDQLGQSMLSRTSKPQAEWDEETQRVAELRKQLNGLVKALHAPGATGVSPRAAIGRAVRWQDIHRFRLDWGGGLLNDRAKSAEELALISESSRKLGQAFSELDEKDRLVFSDIARSDWSHAWQNKLVENAQKLVAAIDELHSAAKEFSDEAGFENLTLTTTSAQGLSQITEVLPLAVDLDLSFGLDSNSRKLIQVFDTSLTTLARLHDFFTSLSCQYPKEKLTVQSISEVEDRWEIACSSYWPLKVIRRWSCSRAVKKTFDLAGKPNLDQDIGTLRDIRAKLSELEKSSAQLDQFNVWEGIGTDSALASRALEAARKLTDGITKLATNAQEFPILKADVKRICTEAKELLEPGFPLNQAAKRVTEAFSMFNSVFERFSIDAELKDVPRCELSELRKKAQGVVDLQPRINAWCRWQLACRNAESYDLKGLITSLEGGLVEPSESEENFQTAYCFWLASRIIDTRDELRKFSAMEHEEKIRTFRKLDENLQDLAVDYIRAKISGEIPDEDDPNRHPGYGVLNREIQKRRRHMPVRKLVQEMGPALTTLTPCLLMSPLSISQFLAAENQLFDLVVFDEASQITTWDAIGATARGKSVIIVGDPKQMPPTSFFDRSASEDGEIDYGAEDLESILDEALAASVKLHRLTGHYRSKHESLICFSNHRYYRGELVTFPSCETKESAVSFVKVNGQYTRGKGRNNPDEAKAVVKEVVRRLNHTELSKNSIGIVTLNTEQQRTIEDLLDQARREDPELEQYFSEDYEEPVFVKNLETVQGDQRDIILLSVGYGPTDPGGKTMSMNFGPLNKQGGERRLNVAITRATTELVIFSSFDPSMIDLTRTSAEAVRDLKHYMEFAQRGPVALGEAVAAVGGLDAFDSDFEEAVATGLRKRGWTVHTQIGVSKFRIDLGVVHPDQPGRYLAGIECDGATYHSSPSARDRDRVRHNILENLNWKLVRLWSTDYWIDPARSIEGIHNRLTELLENDRNASQESQLEEDELENTPANLSTDGNNTTAIEKINEAKITYSAIQAQGSDPLVVQPLSASDFYEESYLLTLQKVALSIVDDSGPIAFNHLCTKIARAHGFARTGAQIRSQIRKAIGDKRRKTESPNGDEVFWADHQDPKAVFDYRGMEIGGEKRDWADIPYPEKLGLARSVLGSADPVVAMASQIGLGRIRRATREELERLVQEASSRLTVGELSATAC